MKTDITPTIVAQKITIEYDPIEDRLLFHCGLANQISASFYLTLRFTRLLIHHLFSHDRLRGLKESFESAKQLSLPEQTPVSPESSDLDGGDVKTEPWEKTVTTKSYPQKRTRRGFPLLERCDVTTSDGNGVILIFDVSHSAHPRRIKLALKNDHLVQFFIALHAQTLLAGWPDDAWITLDTTRENRGSVTLH